ncbi:uncharacterized protein LOC111318401 isoform X2 [Durio zibethinus]|uniref:Uncharacterized protein LOC111318401 isoform X2 n=1 Tax=Durio zibethinus TaxID=66656 RepID=A0A6P6BIQ1_DURZI|nr:uncharacterized protein LOC111318401 isoform X2 [Durio zibethinus]
MCQVAESKPVEQMVAFDRQSRFGLVKGVPRVVKPIEQMVAFDRQFCFGLVKGVPGHNSHVQYARTFQSIKLKKQTIMAVHCNSVPISCKTWRDRAPKPLSTLLPTRLFSLPQTPFSFRSDALKLSTCGGDRVVAAVVSEESAVESSSYGTDVFKLTYLEGNSWLWDVSGVRILVDPILVGNLDFGIPWLYDAAKKFLRDFKLTDLPQVDCLLITQSLDDHCHLKTLKPLSEMSPNLRVIATPNAKSLLDPLCRNVTYLEPGQDSEVEAGNGSKVRIKATAGPVLGPPWQRPENGYLVISQQGQLTLYYEPHCAYNKNFLEKERADIVITPVIKQLLPNFTLVSGQEDAVQLAKLLHAKFIVPMKNGDLDSQGLLASIIQAEGTVESFKPERLCFPFQIQELLSKEIPDARTLEPTPGVPLQIPPH